MKKIDLHLSDYNPALTALIAPDKINELGAGSADRTYYDRLQTFDLSAAVSPLKIKDKTFAEACHAALWLRHDYLDASHTISQGIDTATGSYWHGAMHRREGDYWNSKYWFRRVGEHPVFAELETVVKHTFGDFQETGLFLPADGQRWDPFHFIDLVERTIGSGSDTEDLCKNVQRLEWLMLFDYTYRQAVED